MPNTKQQVLKLLRANNPEWQEFKRIRSYVNQLNRKMKSGRDLSEREGYTYYIYIDRLKELRKRFNV